MLNIMFKRTKILYPALEDFDVDIEKMLTLMIYDILKINSTIL